MPWKIDHKCNMAQAEPGEFGVLKVTDEHGRPVTRIFCPNPECREQFLIVGHEAFTEAVDARDALLSGMPPGFVVVRSKRSQ